MEQRDQFVRSCMLDFSSRERENRKKPNLASSKNPIWLFAFQGGKEEREKASLLMKIQCHHAADQVCSIQLNFFPSFLTHVTCCFPISSIFWETFESMHLELIIYALRGLCTADNVKWNRRSDSFCSRNTHGVKMLKKALLEFWVQNYA